MTQKLSKKEQTHQRILNAASRNFRSHGYAGIGVDGIAKTAEVTSGAFYSHFGSKDGAFGAAVEAGLDEVIKALPEFQEKDGDGWVQSFAEYYLSQTHRDDLACGCAMTTLSPEVVRASPEFHSTFEKKMKQIVNIIATGLKGENSDICQSKAWSMLGVLIGGLTLARAVKSKKLANDIANSITASAVAVACT